MKKSIINLTEKNRDVEQLINNAESSADIPGLVAGAEALSINWKQRLKDVQSLSTPMKIQAALEIERTLQKGIEGLETNRANPASIRKLSKYRLQAESLVKSEVSNLNHIVAENKSVNAREILNISRQIQEYQNQMEANKQAIPKWLSQTQNEMANIAKIVRSQLPRHIPKAAAQKGDAMRRATDAMVSMIEDEAQLKPLGTSNQDVFIGTDVVFKRTEGNRPAEEEHLADGLGAIFDPDTYVPQIRVQTMSPQKMGASVLTPDKDRRAIHMKNIYHDSPQEQILSKALESSNVKKLLTKQSKNRLTQDRQKIAESVELDGYIKEWRTRTFETDKGEVLSFDALAKKIVDGTIDQRTLILGKTLFDHKEPESSFMKAVRQVTLPAYQMGQLYLDLDTGFDADQSLLLKKAFDCCEKRIWLVRDPTGRWTKVGTLEMLLARRSGMGVQVQDYDQLNFVEELELNEALEALDSFEIDKT